jgi:NADH:ubiquinone oxidoreductase subunit 4 (subunit M)
MPLLVLISIKNIKKNIKFYGFLVLGIELMLIFTFLSFVILLFFFSFEMVLILVSLLVSQWGSKLYKIRSSFYLFLFTVFGSVFFLICIVILLLITGTNNCTWDFSIKVNQQIPMTLLFTLALGIKLPIFPFHIWLPEVHSESDSSGSLLLAGILLKLGNYGLIRFSLTLFPIGSCYWSLFIFLLATYGSILGSINCLTIYDIKQIIA